MAGSHLRSLTLSEQSKLEKCKHLYILKDPNRFSSSRHNHKLAMES